MSLPYLFTHHNGIYAQEYPSICFVETMEPKSNQSSQEGLHFVLVNLLVGLSLNPLLVLSHNGKLQYDRVEVSWEVVAAADSHGGLRSPFDEIEVTCFAFSVRFGHSCSVLSWIQPVKRIGSQLEIKAFDAETMVVFTYYNFSYGSFVNVENVLWWYESFLCGWTVDYF